MRLRLGAVTQRDDGRGSPGSPSVSHRRRRPARSNASAATGAFLGQAAQADHLLLLGRQSMLRGCETRCGVRSGGQRPQPWQCRATARAATAARTKIFSIHRGLLAQSGALTHDGLRNSGTSCMSGLHHVIHQPFCAEGGDLAAHALTPSTPAIGILERGVDALHEDVELRPARRGVRACAGRGGLSQAIWMLLALEVVLCVASQLGQRQLDDIARSSGKSAARAPPC